MPGLSRLGLSADDQTDRPMERIFMGAWHTGHRNAGLGRGTQV
jgi:hypothetical protein